MSSVIWPPLRTAAYSPGIVLGTRNEKEAMLTVLQRLLGQVEGSWTPRDGEISMTLQRERHWTWVLKNKQEFARLARGGMDIQGNGNSALGAKI